MTLRRFLPIDRYYTMVERTIPVSEDEEIVVSAVKIKRGKYRGVIYVYGGFDFEPIEGSDQMKMMFQYSVLENPKGVDTDTEKFVNFIGDIAAHIIENEGDKVEYI